MALPPGPRGPAALQTLKFILRPVELMESCAKRYGELFTVTLTPPRRTVVFISDPAAIKAVYTTHQPVAPSAAGASPIAPIMGPNSVIVLIGPEHMRQRKLLLPPFHGDRLQGYGEVIREIAAAEVATWPVGEELALHARMQAITLEVILRVVFGVREVARLDALRAALLEFLAYTGSKRAIITLLRGLSAGTVDGRVGELSRAVDTLLYEEISTRREAGDLAERDDILSLLITARDDDGEPMTDRELRDELVTLLLAGHETTATSLAWMFERLLRRPDAHARLVDEIDAGEDAYLEAAIREILRLRPVVPTASRNLTEPIQLNGYDMPVGTMVSPCVYLTHMNPRLYDRPTEFLPERFLENPPETYSWIPFGGGIRRCIGAAFAQYEMRVILQAVLGPGGVRLAPSGRPEPMRRRNITLAPARGALGRVSERRIAPVAVSV